MRNITTLIFIVSAILMIGYFSYNSYTLNLEDINLRLVSKIAFSVWFLIVIYGLSKKKTKNVNQ
jgi:hypothetical protein